MLDIIILAALVFVKNNLAYHLQGVIWLISALNVLGEEVTVCGRLSGNWGEFDGQETNLSTSNPANCDALITSSPVLTTLSSTTSSDSKAFSAASFSSCST